MARMNQAQRIIGRFGGLTAMARALGHKNPTTVQGWKLRGVIPPKQQQKVLDAGQSLPEPLTPADFFEATAQPSAPQAESPAASEKAAA